MGLSAISIKSQWVKPNWEGMESIFLITDSKGSRVQVTMITWHNTALMSHGVVTPVWMLLLWGNYG